jgi:thiosulfate/3-mercaptopyruvate sulfurtransferase
MLDPIISPSELAALSDAVLLDCRTGPGARERYEKAHLKGALFVDLETDLSEKGDPECGGRHPLPEARTFGERLGRWGVRPSSYVVAYDEQGGANAAARLWWMLRAIGHERVQVLDGGLQAAQAAGLPVTSEASVVHEAPPYPAERYLWPSVDIERVDEARQSADACVLDVRAAARYRGDEEPIDPIAGHIPGARNIPLSENLEGGKFKSAGALRALYEPVFAGKSPQDVIVHCGSGVTACHTLLAMERAGLSGASLYVGSWSEWCRQPERPREP